MIEIGIAIIMTIAFIIAVMYHIYVMYNLEVPICPTSPVCMGSPSRMGLDYNPKTDRVDSLLIKLQHLISLLQNEGCKELRKVLPSSKKEFMEKAGISNNKASMVKCDDLRERVIELKKRSPNNDIYLAILDVWSEIEEEVCDNKSVDLDRLWSLYSDILDSFCPGFCK
jgi:hypothetical protein